MLEKRDRNIVKNGCKKLLEKLKKNNIKTHQQNTQIASAKKQPKRVRTIAAYLSFLFIYFLVGGGVAFWLNQAFGVSQIVSTFFIDIWFIVIFGFVNLYLTNSCAFLDTFGLYKYEFSTKESCLYFIEFLVVALLCQLGAVCLNGLVSDSGFQNYSSEMSGGSVGFTLLLTIFVAPVLEEFLYRGLLFRGFSKAMPLWLAVTISSLLFGLSHGTVLHIFSGTFMGIFCCLVYYKTNRIFIPILVHIGYNFFAVLMTGFSVPDFMVSIWFVSVFSFLTLCLIYTQLKQAKDERLTTSVTNMLSIEIGNICDAKMNQSTTSFDKLK